MLPALLLISVALFFVGMYVAARKTASVQPPSIKEQAPNETFVPSHPLVPQHKMDSDDALAMLTGKRGPIPVRLLRVHTRSFGLDGYEFEAAYREIAGFVARRFYSKVAGTSHANPDGSRRDVAIALCQDFEQLFLVHDAANQFSENAMAVMREEGQQLGYLPEHTAKEVFDAITKARAKYRAIFRHANFHPDTGAVVGAVILIVRLL